MSRLSSRSGWFGILARAWPWFVIIGCVARGEEDEEGFQQVGSAEDGGTDGSSGSGGETGGSGGTGEEGGSGGSGGTEETGGAGGSETGGTGGSETGGTGGSETGGTGGTGGAGGTGGTGGTSTGGTGGTSTGGTGGTSTGGTGGTSTGGTGGTSTGGTGGTSTGGTGGTSTGGTGGACIHDDTEPNNTESTPQILDSITDCDSDGDTVAGTLELGNDKDWFTLHASDKFGCSVNPSFKLQSSASALMCAYFLCDSGGDNLNCPTGSSVDTSPGGLSGCCTTTGTLEPSIGCSGTNDSSQVYFVVHAPSNAGCQSYSVSYHY